MTMHEKLHFLIVDDDEFLAAFHKTILENEGHKVTVYTSSPEALTKIKDIQPDCIISDLLMPELDGFELFDRVRKIQNIKQPIFVILTGKIFEYDHRRALELGVDGYLTKPVNPETFVKDLLEIVDVKIHVQFWGVRGTLPVPGKMTTVFGGNTNCVTLTFAKKYFLIFDAGSGIKALSNHLMFENKFPISAKIFISHPHYDHINGFPFFSPLYMKGNEFEIFGTNQGGIGIEKLLSDQMNSIYFPITMNEFYAKLNFRNLTEESFYIGELHIHTIFLNHPGKCLGFKVQHKNKSFCYITDNELYLTDSPHYNQHEVDRLINFIKNANLVVMDATYTDEEYLKKIGWGHSCVSRVADICDKANVKLLCLYHHDPDQFDKDISLKLQQAQLLLANSQTQCIAPREGDNIII